MRCPEQPCCISQRVIAPEYESFCNPIDSYKECDSPLASNLGVERACVWDVDKWGCAIPEDFYSPYLADVCACEGYDLGDESVDLLSIACYESDRQLDENTCVNGTPTCNWNCVDYSPIGTPPPDVSSLFHLSLSLPFSFPQKNKNSQLCRCVGNEATDPSGTYAYQCEQLQNPDESSCVNLINDYCRWTCPSTSTTSTTTTTTPPPPTTSTTTASPPPPS